ncbi:MAG: Rrf2 family transcriptional regulator, partial [Deltaproteobacteria bacterium]|nr:Rrf2 family transcriptional regulator [Deltaproteobacteria bacterium]
MAANTHFAVAVHALTVLAYTERLTKSDFVAASINTNPVVVRRIMGQLAREGLVRSVPGKNGGFELAKPATKIPLVDVLHAVDGGGVFRIHDNEENPVCTVSCGMKSALGDVLKRVDGAVDRELSKTSV